MYSIKKNRLNFVKYIRRVQMKGWENILWSDGNTRQLFGSEGMNRKKTTDGKQILC